LIAYFDTSALIKRVLDESGSSLASEIWESAASMVSSEMVYPEARAALAAARRAGRLDRSELREAVCRLERLYGDLEIVRTDDALTSLAGGLAERHSLRGYDAVHLAAVLAIEARRVVVATWDRALSAASTANGLGTLPYYKARAAA
jgi:uncharacterized protein